MPHPVPRHRIFRQRRPIGCCNRALSRQDAGGRASLNSPLADELGYRRFMIALRHGPPHSLAVIVRACIFSIKVNHFGTGAPGPYIAMAIGRQCKRGGSARVISNAPGATNRNASTKSSKTVNSSVLARSTNSREIVMLTLACPSRLNSICAPTPRSLASSSSAWSRAAAMICSSGSSFISDTSHEIWGRQWL